MFGRLNTQSKSQSVNDDGYFDIQNKRLINIGKAVEGNDAVSLNIVKDMIKTEVNRHLESFVTPYILQKTLTEETTKLRNQIESMMVLTIKGELIKLHRDINHRK